jgi:hypothetical protein
MQGVSFCEGIGSFWGFGFLRPKLRAAEPVEPERGASHEYGTNLEAGVSGLRFDHLSLFLS